jgi:muramidase (phage lysozyme)
MSTIADIVRRERAGGSSRTGSLFSAVGKKTLETIDPRRFFNRTGLLTALFPSLKSFQAKGATSGSKLTDVSSPLASPTSPLLVEMNLRLTNMENTSKITAKNSMTLPSMSRDMNIMRQNVIKLVRLQGGKASTRADAFFLRAFERERATEAELQAAKERRATGRASPVTTIKESASTGILGTLLAPLLFVFNKISSLMGTLTGALSSLSNLIAPLLKGGISLLFDMAGSFARLAIKGGGTLFDYIKKIPLSKMLRGLIAFLSSKGAIAALPIAAVAGLLSYLYTHEATQTDSALEGATPEDTSSAPPPPGSKGLAQLKDEQDRANKALKAGTEADRDSSYARAESARFQRQATSTSPTRVPNKSVTPGADGELLDFIAAKESGGDYNAVFGQGSVPGLSDMTIAQVLDYQKQLLAQGQKSSAVGRYQFIRSSLAEEAKAAGIDINKEKFTPEMQDKLILNRLKRIRGLDKFRRGEITSQQFAENLSMEFASLPSPIKGGGTKSFYEGLAGNKALTGMSDVYAAIESGRPASGTAVASVSSDIETTRMNAMTPTSLIPLLSTLAAPKTPSLQKQQLNIPSTIDTDLYEGLVARITEYA